MADIEKIRFNREQYRFSIERTQEKTLQWSEPVSTENNIVFPLKVFMFAQITIAVHGFNREQYRFSIESLKMPV